jgi:Tfp pilus assembly protein PilV
VIHRPTRAARRRRDDSGETLLELLIAITIIGLGVTAILGAVMIAVSASTLDQRQVQAQARLKSWAEKLSAAPYVDCATTASYSSYAAFATQTPPTQTPPAQTPPTPALPSGFTASYVAVQSWNGTGFVDTMPSCTAGAAGTDRGVQRVQLRITAAPTLYPGFSTDLWVTLRKPCATAGIC